MGSNQIIIRVPAVHHICIPHLIPLNQAPQFTPQFRQHVMHPVFLLCIAQPCDASIFRAAYIIKTVEQIFTILDVSNTMLH